MPYIIVFSVCKKLLIRREEILDYLRQHVADIELLSFELDDQCFKIRIKTRKCEDLLIQRLVLHKGLEIDLVSCDKIIKITQIL